MRNLLFLIAAAGLVAGAAPARADRVQVFSLTGLHCADCGVTIQHAVKKVKGVKKMVFDYHTVEATITMSDQVTDGQILGAIRAAETGFGATPGAGHGAYQPFPAYPESADVAVLTNDGSAVGRLDSLRVAGKYTVFDVYAEWCMPCRAMDAALRGAVENRRDIAVRRLNVVSFDSALAKELGAGLRALPYVVVFAPDGKRTAVTGLHAKKVLEALAAK